MNKKEKIDNFINNISDILIKNYISNIEETNYHFIVKGKPINYVRERSGKNHFYNPKESLMKDYKNKFISSLTEEQKKYTKNIITNENSDYYIEMIAKYYLPIPVGDSAEKTALKELKIIRPIIRPDLDNYDKFLIDSLHDVVYDDDKRVVRIDSEKYYSLNPRTELDIKIIYKK